MGFGWLFLASALVFASPRPEAIEQAPLVRASDILDWVETQSSPPVRSVEALIEKLPRAYRSYFVLQYESHSNHQADPLHPRIIFFGPDAKLLVGVSGLVSDPFYNTIEMIEYEPQSASFSFYSIHFDSQGQKPQVERNPKDCQRCHGPDPKPNWESYNLWPGAYGSVHDQILAGTEEHQWFQKFVATYPSSSRYRFLPSPFFVEAQDSFGSRHFYLSHQGVGPGSSLSILLNFLNRDRMAKRLLSSPKHLKYRPAFVAALIGCPQPITEFLSRDLKDQHPIDYSQTLTETRDLMIKDFNRKLKVLVRHLGIPQSKIAQQADPFGMRPEEQERVAKLRFLLTQRNSKIDFDRWPLSISKTSLDFNDGVSGLENLIGHYLPLAYSEKEPLRQLIRIQENPFSFTSLDSQTKYTINTFSLSSEIEPACELLLSEARGQSLR